MITFPIGYHWKCVRGHCVCAESRDPWVGGQKQLHIWNPRPRFAYSLYNFYWATTTIKGRVLSSVTNAKAVDCVNYLCVTCDLDLWPFDLEQLSFMASHETNLATKYEDPKPIRSWVTSYNGFPWLALEMRMRPMHMRRITWPVSRGKKQLHIWNPRPRFAYSLYNFHLVQSLRGPRVQKMCAKFLFTFMNWTMWHHTFARLCESVVRATMKVNWRGGNLYCACAETVIYELPV